MADLSNILIVTDLDGTFFGKHGSPIERNLEAVERLKAQGGHFTIATGRTNLNLKHKWSDAADLVNAPVVGCNGAMLCDLRTDRIIEGRLMNREHVMDIIEIMVRDFPDLGARISVEEGFLSSPGQRERCHEVDHDLERVAPAKVFTLPEEDWFSVPDWYKVVVRGTPERTDEFRAVIEAKWPERFMTSKSGVAYLEFQAPGITKATMLPALREYVEKKVGKPVRLFACGDYENDLAMLKLADVAVCPTNALDCVKAVSDICLCHHTEGLIASLIELIEEGKI
ncbi:MAG: HAD-IIB family hydrolase [Clostridia bacterium]|nr:HAD-IIB family hydrolase [Clostridia bacterium]